VYYVLFLFHVYAYGDISFYYMLFYKKFKNKTNKQNIEKCNKNNKYNVCICFVLYIVAYRCRARFVLYIVIIWFVLYIVCFIVVLFLLLFIVYYCICFVLYIVVYCFLFFSTSVRAAAARAGRAGPAGAPREVARPAAGPFLGREQGKYEEIRKISKQ